MTRFYGPQPRRTAVVHGGPGDRGSLGGMARRLAYLLAEAGKTVSGDESLYGGVVEPWQSARSAEGLVEELHGQMESAAARPAALVGHSWGAMLSLLYAARYPAEVSRVILVGCPPLDDRYVPLTAETRRARLSDAERKEYDRVTAVDSPDAHDMELLRRLTEKTDDFDATPAEGEADAGTYAAVWPEAARMRSDGRLKRVLESLRCPVTAIHGLCDPHPVEGVTVPLKEAGVVFRAYTIPFCGHSPFRERRCAAIFYRIVLQALIARPYIVPGAK